MKWTGVYLIGYVILICGVLAALWLMEEAEDAGEKDSRQSSGKGRYVQEGT